MGLMDRDYWKEKHTGKTSVRKDIQHLQASLDRNARAPAPAPRVRPTPSAWPKIALWTIGLCALVFVILSIVGKLAR